ncbi:uncharacterized protein LOC123885137 isoform X2 [Trifolium pratense]|uniref:uncharacterized protein LOC123885137 isoform X2 n=1 Tax=Trifolium pratense TaxID=57577 RepID=UPI001E6910C0|nr:uncharacterized protein LOC123885137 isoform X2 [Trifolium pratense]
MGVKHVMGTGTYLGLPSMVGRSKKATFGYIKDRIWKKINSWRGRALSKAGIRWLAWDRLARPKSEGGLGFRNFQAFNMSMVAKQAWNFVAKPHTLVARIYKARYFPRSSLFDAKIGDNPSFVWRSIWKSRDVLVNGCRWKIGDGSKIKIMSEPWLRGEDTLWMQSPQTQKAVAENIIKTPLFEEVKEDQVVWQYENHGVYTVKSGYRHYIKNKSVNNNYTLEGDWGALWRSRAPPKTKHLLWRVCRDCLPTRLRLRERYVPCPSECALCVNNTEDDWHVFFGCSESRQVWNEAGLGGVIDPRIRQYDNVKAVFFDICRNETDDIAGIVATIAWSIWHNRNNWVWNGVKDTAKGVATTAAHLIGEWRAVHVIQQQHSATAAVLTQSRISDTGAASSPPIIAADPLRWQRPRDGWWKCNVDASFSQASGQTGWGWCIRNSQGVFVAAGTNMSMHKLAIVEGEAMAILEAMRQATSRGWSNIVFESDSKVVVDAIQANHHGIAELSSIILSIKLLLQCNSNFEIKFTKRQANMAAHTLARAAISWSSRMFFHYVPRCIEPFIINEMS